MGRLAKVLPVSLLLAAIIPHPASAATSVAISSATVSGTSVLVSGGSSYDAQPFITVGTDAANDAPAGVAQNGGDVTAAAMATSLTGQVMLRWKVASLPPGANGSPAITYGWTFCIGEENCFEMDLGRMAFNPPSADPYGVLWRCSDSSCDPGGQSRFASAVPATFDGATSTVTLTLPSSAGATPGATVTPVSLDASGPAFTMLGTAEPFTAQYDSGDGVGQVADFTVAAKQVSLAVGAPGQPPASVVYTATVTPGSSGQYSGAVDVSGYAPGDYAVYARACFGANNCAYGSSPVTIA